MAQRFGHKWRVQVRVGGRLLGHVWTRKGDAEAEERELKREQELIRAGLSKPRSKVLMIDAAAAWLRAREKDPALKKGTTTQDEARLRLYILPRIGGLPVQGIKPAM